MVWSDWSSLVGLDLVVGTYARTYVRAGLPSPHMRQKAGHKRRRIAKIKKIRSLCSAAAGWGSGSVVV